MAKRRSHSIEHLQVYRKVQARFLMSGSGHVWTAPWQDHSDGVAALVGSGHVSGLLMRRNGRWP
jgi:hypothetical protein